MPKETDGIVFIYYNVFILFIEELKEHFVQYGEITNISLKTDPATGRSRGFAFIIFKSVDGLNNVRLLIFVINIFKFNFNIFGKINRHLRLVIMLLMARKLILKRQKQNKRRYLLVDCHLMLQMMKSKNFLESGVLL